MNNSIKIFFPIISLTLLSSCCTNVSQNNSGKSNQEIVGRNPAVVTINQSIITARIDKIIFDDNNNFKIEAIVTRVEENPAYQSMALVNETYELTPNFQLDDEHRIIAGSEKNTRLNSLSKLKPGAEIRAEIFFEQSKGWFIQDVLSN